MPKSDRLPVGMAIVLLILVVCHAQPNKTQYQSVASSVELDTMARSAAGGEGIRVMRSGARTDGAYFGSLLIYGAIDLRLFRKEFEASIEKLFLEKGMQHKKLVLHEQVVYSPRNSSQHYRLGIQYVEKVTEDGEQFVQVIVADLPNRT